MSTRSSFFYSHDTNGQIHVFEDLAGESDTIYIEKTQTIDTKLALSVEESILIGQSFDINELKRQAALSDESLRAAAVAYVKEMSGSAKFLRNLFFADLPNGERTPEEEQIEFRFQQFCKTRDKLKNLLSSVLSKLKNVHKFYFGLENIK